MPHLGTMLQSGLKLEEKYGLHAAHQALLPPGDRNARSVKAPMRTDTSGWNAVVPAVAPSLFEARLIVCQVNYQPFFTTLDDLMEFAKGQKHHFDGIVEKVGRATNGSWSRPPLKGRPRGSATVGVRRPRGTCIVLPTF